MSKEQKSSNNEKSEEVDLIVFFNLIGNVFQRLYNWINYILKSVFKVLISILSHFYQRVLWYVIAIVIGLVFGVFTDKKSEKIYGANMFIETNYNSGYQVYENMKNLNELAKIDKDTLELARLLNITTSEASSLRGFYIQPDIDPAESMQMFSDYRAGLDSVAKSEVKYKEFISSINRFNYTTHKIGVASITKGIYKKLNRNLPKVLSANPYLDKLKQVGQENYLREEKTLVNQQKKIDSLVRVYLQIRNRESNKLSKSSGGGMNLYLGNATKNELLVNEAQLIQEKLNLEEQRREVIKKRVTQENLLSVISNFPSSGYDMSEWYDDKKIQYPLILFSLLFLVFVFIGLGKFVRDNDIN